MFRKGSSGREAGAAVAVLAIYVLTLLLPLHQAAGLQRDLAKLGYATTSSWSVCATLADNERGTPTAVKCPAAGVGKTEFTGPIPISTEIDMPSAYARVVYARASGSPALSLCRHSAQARAPPVTV